MSRKLLRNWDVSAMYPTIMIVFNLLSRNVPDPEKFKRMVDERLKAKGIGDLETAKKLKVPVNTVYGILLQVYSECYDPRNGRSVCVTGQLLLTDLAIKLCNVCKTTTLINVNTDGIAFEIDEDEMEKAYEVKKQWETITGCELEEDVIKRIIIKDINNYIMELVKSDGSIKVKCKGGYVSNYPHGTFDSNSLSITQKAIVEYFINDIPVEETINACDDPFQFQLIAKTGSTYSKTLYYVNGEEIEVQKVNRLYAVKDESLGVVKKYKKTYLTLDEDGVQRYYINLKGKRTYKKNWETDEKGDFFIKKDTTQNCPPHAFIDNSCQITIDTIDKSWYIELANKRINDFLGIKPEKKEKKKMAKKDEVEVKVVEPRVALLQKIFNVGEILANRPWVMDGYNSHQSYEYVTSDKYREELGRACRTVGLLFKVNIGNRSFEQLEGSKMNLTTIVGTMCFIDPDTGEHEDYMVMGDGTDNLDKGIYKAETLMVKYFVLNNFLLPKQQDEIDPENGKDDKKEESKSKAPVNIVKDEKLKSKPASPQQREDAKASVVEDNFATESTIVEMLKIMDKIREVKEGYGEKTYTKLLDALDGKDQLPKVEAVKMMSKFEERMDELGIE